MSNPVLRCIKPYHWKLQYRGYQETYSWVYEKCPNMPKSVNDMIFRIPEAAFQQFRHDARMELTPKELMDINHGLVDVQALLRNRHGVVDAQTPNLIRVEFILNPNNSEECIALRAHYRREYRRDNFVDFTSDKTQIPQELWDNLNYHLQFHP